MSKPKAPAPPDPNVTAAAQTGTNIGTAIANTAMGQVNQVTPDGSLTYNRTGTYQYRDPISGQTYDLPQYTATTALSPEGQAIHATNLETQAGLSGIARDQTRAIGEHLATPANFDTSAIEGRLYDLGAARLDPRFAREEEALRTSLVNRGIAEGSAAWNSEMERMGQTKNDAYNQLLLTGRGQAFNEVAAQRNQPINEITALLSGSQVNSPNVALAAPDRAANTDYAGIVSNNYNQRMANYNARLNNFNGLMGGLFGLGAAGIRAW